MALSVEVLSNSPSVSLNKSGVVLDRRERQEYPFLTRDGTQRKRGAIKWAVFPQLQHGKDIFAISKETGFTPRQVSRARGHAQEMGELPYLSGLDKRRIKSESLKGRPSHFKGHSHDLATLIRIRESHLGRELTPLEHNQTVYVYEARQIPEKAGMPSVQKVYEEAQRKFPSGKRNEMFIEVSYALEISEILTQSQDEESPYPSRQQIEEVFAQLDPSVLRRMEPEILFIRSKVSEHALNQQEVQSANVDADEKGAMTEEQREKAAAIYARWEDYIRNGAERFMYFNRMAIDDVCSNASLRLLQNVDKIPDDPKEQLNFIFNFVQKAAIDVARANKMAKRDYRKSEPLDLSNPAHHGSNRSAEETAMDRSDIKQVAPILNRYPHARDYLISGDTMKEVAMRNGVPEDKVKTQLHLLRKNLRQ